MERLVVSLWKIIEVISLWFLKVMLRIFNKDLTDEMAEHFMQFIKFGMVGVSNTIVSYLVNVIVLLMLSRNRVPWDYLAGNIVAFVIGVLWSFYWNNKFVFIREEDTQRNICKALLKTYVSYALTGLVLNNLLSWMWIVGLGISKYVAPIINLFLSVPLNFVLNKLWAFKA